MPSIHSQYTCMLQYLVPMHSNRQYCSALALDACMISAETTAHAAHSWSEVLMPERTDPWFGRIHTKSCLPSACSLIYWIERTIRAPKILTGLIHALRSAIHGHTCLSFTLALSLPVTTAVSDKDILSVEQQV